MSDGPPEKRDATRTAASELREYARGELDVDHRDLDPVAGLVEDDDVRDLLIFARQAWDRHRDPDEPAFDKTHWGRRRIQRYASETAGEAVEAGNVSQMEYLTGMPEYQSDVSGLHALQQLESWLIYSEAVKMVYLAGHMGEGKTSFSHLLGEVVEHRSEHDDDLADAEIATNIPSSEYQAITDYPTFREWVLEGDVEDNRWFIFDEASGALTGYSHDRRAVEQLMSRLVKLSRKYGCNLIVIGHTGMDLHADLRRLSDYVTKPSKKTARFYAGVRNGEGTGHLFDLNQLPDTNKQFRTDDEAPWSWGDALEDDEAEGYTEEEVKELRNQRIRRLYRQTEVTQKDLSAAFDISDRQVRRILNENA